MMASALDAKRFAKRLDSLLDEIERTDLRLRVDTDGRLYICRHDPTYDSPGPVVAEVAYHTIPWDPEQFKFS